MSYWLEQFLYKHANQIIVNSPGFIEFVKEKGGKEISLIPNGADIALFNNINVSEIRKDLGWNNNFIVLYAGAMVCPMISELLLKPHSY